MVGEEGLQLPSKFFFEISTSTAVVLKNDETLQIVYAFRPTRRNCFRNKTVRFVNRII